MRLDIKLHFFLWVYVAFFYFILVLFFFFFNLTSLKVFTISKHQDQIFFFLGGSFSNYLDSKSEEENWVVQFVWSYGIGCIGRLHRVSSTEDWECCPIFPWIPGSKWAWGILFMLKIVLPSCFSASPMFVSSTRFLDILW